jgi:lipoate---protein ligase
VIGSRQEATIVAADRVRAADAAVVRRRSGGGAVLVTPDEPLWIDVWVPADDPLWTHDVDRAFDWLGDTWVATLSDLGVREVRAARQAIDGHTRWASVVCFGGIGTGEVVTSDTRKIVGLSQRRDRRGAWFQCSCVLQWDPAPLVDLLALSSPERAAVTAELTDAVVGVADLLPVTGTGTAGEVAQAITEAFIERLPLLR